MRSTSSSRPIRECAVCGNELAPRQKAFCSRDCHRVWLEAYGPYATGPEPDRRYRGFDDENFDWDLDT